MPLNNNHYQAPTWVNDQQPAIDATELQAISDRLQALDAGGLLYESKETTLPVNATGANLYGLAYGQDNGIWLAGGSAVLVYSADGMNWETVDLSSVTADHWRTILYSNGMYVIAGSTYCAYAETADVIDSWTQVSPATSVPGGWSCGAALDGTFYLFAGRTAGSNVYAYGDGKTWTEDTLPTSTRWAAAAAGAGNVVVISGSFSNTALYSDWFSGWNETTLPAALDWQGVAFGNDKYVAVALNSATAAISEDFGATWSSITLPMSAQWTSITFGNGRFLAVASNSATAITSTDGVNWTTVSLPAARYWSRVASNQADFLAVASNSNIGAFYSASAFSSLFHTLDVMIDAAKTGAVDEAKNALETSTGSRSGTEAADFTIPCNALANAVIYYSESGGYNYSGFFIAIRGSSTNFVVYPQSSSSVTFTVDDHALEWSGNTITVPGDGSALQYTRFNSRGVNYSYAVFY